MAILSSDLIRQGAAGASTGYTINNSIRFNIQLVLPEPEGATTIILKGSFDKP